MTRKTKQGVVVSDKMDKTVTVSIERRCRDGIYGKVIKRRKKYYVHDEKGIAHCGDTVLIEETRPLSKLKCWKVVSIVQKNGQAETEAAVAG